jgi:hypothetical protein
MSSVKRGARPSVSRALQHGTRIRRRDCMSRKLRLTAGLAGLKTARMTRPLSVTSDLVAGRAARRRTPPQVSGREEP